MNKMIRLVVETSGRDICAYVAESDYDKANGLNDWGQLPLGAGLFFVQEKPDEVYFYMDRVSFPIDIIMMDQDGVVRRVYENCLPGSTDRYIGFDIKFILEMRAGEAKRNQIYQGTSIKTIIRPYEFSTLVRPDLLAMHAAYNSFIEGGISSGAVLAINETSIAWGWNKTLQQANPVKHAEMDAIENCLLRGSSLENSQLYTTHMPCMMCGAAAAWSKVSVVKFLLDSNNSSLVKISNFTGGNIPVFMKL